VADIHQLIASTSRRPVKHHHRHYQQQQQSHSNRISDELMRIGSQHLTASERH